MKKSNMVISAIMGCFMAAWSFLAVNALDLNDIDNPKVTEAFVDGLVLPLMKNHHSPSGTVAIVKGGKLVFAKGYGFQNIEENIPVNPYKTLFRPGSTSKLFTWVSVMQMVEQGKVDLDVDVNKYLKKFQIKDTYPDQPVTMRHILTHTGGFEESSLGYMILKEASQIIPLVDALAKHQPDRVTPPGAQTSYSNYATALAGLIVANVSGMEFNAYVRKNIFDVLGMKNSSFFEPLPEALNADMALAYSFEGGEYVEQPFELVTNFGPAGGMSASAVDMTKFAQAILNGGIYEDGRILKATTVKEMLTRNFSHDDRMVGMALGFYETEHNGVRLVGHGGDLIYFHTDLGIDQENNLAFFVSFSGHEGSVVRSAFVGAFYDAFHSIELERINSPADFSDRAEKYTGTYRHWRTTFSTVEKVIGVMMDTSVVSTENNTLVIPDVWGFSTEYVEIGNNLFRQKNGSEKIAFQENEKGEITGFVMDGIPFMSTFKIPFHETVSFHFLLIGFSLLVFVGVVLHQFYQRAVYRALSDVEKTATRASLIVSVTNLLAIILCVVLVLPIFSAGQFMSQIPFLFKVWLLLPIIATAAGMYHVYNTVLVWKNAQSNTIGMRIRYTLVTIGALFMGWLYYYWNIIGFQYHG